jgi:hypothetical protein
MINLVYYESSGTNLVSAVKAANFCYKFCQNRKLLFMNGGSTVQLRVASCVLGKSIRYFSTSRPAL